jgi:acyl carrier protein
MQAEETTGSRAELALRFVIFGGEALEIQSLKPWFERHGEVRPQLVNMYGITETTVHVTYRALTMSDVNKSTGSIIGKPMPDLQVYVLDPKQQPVPVGIPGELYVGGAGLSRNYLNRSELTAERFIPDPFSGEVGARLYKSGDLARYLPNGDLEFLGRMDEQVKVRGYRIESGDIEAALNKCPGVRESVVTLHEDGHNDQQLVAYVVETDSGSLTTTRLHGFLKDLLPDYMVPALFVMLDILPLTANGKVDKRALPAPGQSRPELADAYVGPRSAIEEVLVGIWSEVLHVEQVGIFDNFFELGGHSLLATQVVSRVQDAFQIEVPLRSVFDEPAVAGFAVLMVQNLFEQEGDEDFAQLLQEVELLPEDQIKDLLKQDQKEGAEFCSSFQVNSALPHLAG